MTLGEELRQELARDAAVAEDAAGAEAADEQGQAETPEAEAGSASPPEGESGAELSVDEFLDQMYAEVYPQARAPGQAREEDPSAPPARADAEGAGAEASRPASWEALAERYADDPETAALFREFGAAVGEVPALRKQLEHLRTMSEKLTFIQAARPYEERCRAKFPDWQKVGKRVWALALEKNLTEDQAYALVKLERGETRLSPPASAGRQEAASPPVRPARTVRPGPEHADASADVQSIRDGVIAAVEEAKRNKVGIFG